MGIYIGRDNETIPHRCEVCNGTTLEPFLLNGVVHCPQCIQLSESPGDCLRCSYPIDNEGECVIDLDHTRAAVQAADQIAVNILNDVKALSFKGMIVDVINQVVLMEKRAI